MVMNRALRWSKYSSSVLLSAVISWSTHIRYPEKKRVFTHTHRDVYLVFPVHRNIVGQGSTTRRLRSNRRSLDECCR